VIVYETRTTECGWAPVPPVVCAVYMIVAFAFGVPYRVKWEICAYDRYDAMKERLLSLTAERDK